MKPSVNRSVHYVARGSADGIYPSACRAAIVTELNHGHDYVSASVGLAVFTPTGIFFDRDVAYSETKVPGTWHWPEREEE